jgi:hypothetical protein
VLHVQNSDAGNTFMAGNDDCGASLRSCVAIPPSGVDRHVLIVVRSYSAWSTGSGVLTLQRCGGSGSCANQDVLFMSRFAGASVYSGNVPAQTRFTTVRQAPGPGEPTSAQDTMIIVRAGKERGISYDDNGGLPALPDVGTGMSMAQIPEACSDCYVTIGTLDGAPQGRVTLVLDEAWQIDSDQDGASDALENGIGTLPWKPDTDEDGLLDGEEIYGTRVGADVLQLPYWGASPRHKDMFVEIDWDMGAPGTPNQYQPSAATIDQMIELFATNDAGNKAGNPDGVGGISVHVDSGLPTEGGRQGTWGGASAVASTLGCSALTPTRVGYFHHVEATAAGTGQAGAGTCVSVQYQSGYNMAHELGHNLYLNHSGRYAAVGNCKPHYRSIMNYQGGPSFSDGTYAATPLNATRLTERTRFGTGDLAWLRQPPYEFTVDDATGWVDWNRDGRFSDSARGAPNFLDRAGCEIAMPHRSDFANAKKKTYASAFLGRLAASVYLFTVDTAGALEFRRAGDLHDCDPSIWESQCPRTWGALTRVPGATSDGTGDAVGLVRPSNLQPMLAVVHKAPTASRVDEPLMYEIMTSDAGGEHWTTPRPVHPTALAGSSTTEPTLVNQDGTVLLFVARSDGYLREYQYDAANDVWSDHGTAILDGQPFIIIPGEGVGVVSGYQRWGTATSSYVFGVFRDPIDGKISLVRRGPFGTWSRLLAGPSDPQAHRRQTSDVPRIAYTPFDPAVSWDGRFTIVSRAGGATTTEMLITEGNDWAGTDRRFRFLPIVADPLNWWGNSTDAYSLLSDPDGLRATMVAPGGVSFYPFFDGVYDANQADQPDFEVLGAQVDCALRCPRARNASTRDRCCPTGVTAYGQDADCDVSGLAPTCTYATDSH